MTHDPYTRTTITRRIVTTHLHCDNCGTPAKYVKYPLPHARLFSYDMVPDDRLRPPNRYSLAAFCSIGCWRQYYS